MSSDAVTGNYNDTAVVADNRFSYERHAFIGWNTMPDGSGEFYEAGGSFNFPDRDTVLYAQWEDILYKLSYDANGGEGDMSADAVIGKYNDTAAVAENGFSYGNHSFINWNTEPDGSGEMYEPGGTFIFPEGDTILYAQWKENSPDPDGGRHIQFFDLRGELPRTGLTGFLPAEPAAGLYKSLRIELDIPQINSHSDVVAVDQVNGTYPVEGLGMRSGLLSDTALPGDGWSVIVGHNTVNSTEFGPFALVRELEPGDRIFVKSGGKQLIFEVYANEKINAEDFGMVKTIASRYENTLTLMTCEDERLEGGYASRRIVSAKALE